MRQRERIAGAVAVAFVAGLLIYLFMAYQAATVGGLSGSSLRMTCMEAARTDDGHYRQDGVRVVRDYLPPQAECRWSDGTTTSLVDLGPFGWAGPVLMGGAVLVLVTTTVQRRRTAHR